MGDSLSYRLYNLWAYKASQGLSVRLTNEGSYIRGGLKKPFRNELLLHMFIEIGFSVTGNQATRDFKTRKVKRGLIFG